VKSRSACSFWLQATGDERQGFSAGGASLPAHGPRQARRFRFQIHFHSGRPVDVLSLERREPRELTSIL
jgi:hypothetical protein